MHDKLKKTGVTLHLFWQEYKQAATNGYQYTEFCQHHHAWAATVDAVLRQIYVADERGFINYASSTTPIVEPRTGEVPDVQIFVGMLGASHLLYIEATWTQTPAD